MDEDEVARAIVETLGNVGVVETAGNRFFFHNPGGGQSPDHRFPFATLVTSDEYDQFSDLNRPGVYRLNIDAGKERFRALFGDQAAPPDDAEPGYDFTALDRVMPHPVYAKQFWVCVLNPSPETFEVLRPLLADAYQRAARRPRKAPPADDA